MDPLPPGIRKWESCKENIKKFYNIDLIYYKQHPHKHMLNSSGLSLPKNNKYVCKTIINWQVLWHILIKLCTINKTWFNSLRLPSFLSVYKVGSLRLTDCNFPDKLIHFLGINDSSNLWFAKFVRTLEC